MERLHARQQPEQLPFTSRVRPDGEGRWLVEVHLAEGAVLSKWFAEEDDALRYPQELWDWLRGRQDGTNTEWT